LEDKQCHPDAGAPDRWLRSRQALPTTPIKKSSVSYRCLGSGNEHSIKYRLASSTTATVGMFNVDWLLLAPFFQRVEMRRASMATETIGKYQLHFFAYELPGSGQWDPYLRIDKFDDDAQDFKCLIENRRASDKPLATYEEAIEQARRTGNMLIREGKV
jgi:hypothetical protein